MPHEDVAYLHNVPVAPRQSPKCQSTQWVGALASALLGAVVWACGPMRKTSRGTPHPHDINGKPPVRWPGSPTGRAITENRIKFVVHSAEARLQATGSERRVMPKRHYEAMVDEVTLEDLAATVESNGISSPVSVCVPHRALCQRPPGSNRHHCVLLAEAARIMLRAYKELVKVRFYSWTDIHEPDYRERVMCYPDQDPMGVLSSAIVAMRFMLNTDILDKHGLDMRVRELLAVILHISYKLKTEASWDRGSYANITVLSCFLCKHEIPEYGWEADWRCRDQHVDSMWSVEAQIVCSQPAFRLFDDTPYQTLETYLGSALECKELGEYEAKLILGTSFFYLYTAALNTERYFLEEIGSECTTRDIGLALAAIGLLSIHLAQSNEPPRSCVESKFESHVLKGALALVSNALDVLAAERQAGKTELTLDKYPPKLLSLASLSKLKAVFAGVMERDLS